jgi:hypothetical protein
MHPAARRKLHPSYLHSPRFHRIAVRFNTNQIPITDASLTQTSADAIDAMILLSKKKTMAPRQPASTGGCKKTLQPDTPHASKL